MPIQVRIGKILFDLALCFLAFTVIPVLIYRVVDPPTTALLLTRWAEAGYEESHPKVFEHWAPLDRISPHLVRAVIAAEDQKFFYHRGFDWQAIEAAIRTNLSTDRKVGASTISMQTARNVFLWQKRNWLRKSLEAWFTILIEALWSKERILEVYLNVIEWGDGLFGCETASRFYFKRASATLSPVEAARMAAVLPSPRRWSVLNPQPHVADRQSKILRVMSRVRIPLRY
ncbi:MAG: monofunctional biosynthetic peptidoglycan transglycosylase [Nitrospinae bacterium]|nr:monofunctional biosynthetic peptidoglycan transglycosylase [Nitrospinota bacterium]